MLSWGLRPEHISLDRDLAPNFTQIGTGKVDIVEPMGSDCLVMDQAR